MEEERRRAGCGIRLFLVSGLLVSTYLALWDVGLIDAVESEMIAARESQALAVSDGSVFNCAGKYCYEGEYNSNPHNQEGNATWYGYEHSGFTANGEVWDPEGITAASWFYDFGTELRVCNVNPVPGLDSCVDVRVTDHGPDRVKRPDLIIDLSKGAFERIAKLDSGVIEVRVIKK